MEEKEIMKILEETGVICRGHFELTSGLHSGMYLQCAKILQFPHLASKLAKEIAKNFNDIDVVVSPAIGGIIIGYAVANELNCRMIFTEREMGEMVLRRNFSIKPDERVLIVEDVITTGGSVKEVIDVVNRNRGKVVGVASLIDRGGDKVFYDDLKSLVNLKIESYRSEVCPLCKDKMLLVKPGSRELE